ncbi:MAG: hypothetical protein GX442_20220 [Candidatus Riflebacteria bacterium]|nr:hypothetical protein [Candidatus Riflebacteria bacterium]
MGRRRGLAVVVVLFFGFAMGLLVYFLIGANANLSLQNRKTIGQLQAYYLAHSAFQHVQLKLRLLPQETYDAFEGGAGSPYPDVDSDLHPAIRFGPAAPKASLFDSDQIVPEDPFDGRYQLVKLTFDSSTQAMKHVQDGYSVEVRATAKGNAQMTFEETLSEKVIVSRFTGGIAP